MLSTSSEVCRFMYYTHTHTYKYIPTQGENNEVNTNIDYYRYIILRYTKAPFTYK